MTQITASVTSQPITASAGGGGITATVGSSTVSAAASGGIGPQGPQGNLGAGLADLTDVDVSAVAEGDLLRYGNAGKWQNFPEANVVIDGANF